jgi:hypothetical protein
MDIKPIPMAAFARFYEASPLNKVVRARNARLMVTDQEAYQVRDYYMDLRNLLSETHWKTGDVASFERALGKLIDDQEDRRKKEHFLSTGRAYIDFWREQKAEYFSVPVSVIEIAGLPIEVVIEVGMRCQGVSFALKLWLNAAKPTRQFRQAVYYMTEMGRNEGWDEEWQPAVWDVRRQSVLTPVPLPREFGLAMEGQAAAFKQMWKKVGE